MNENTIKHDAPLSVKGTILFVDDEHINLVVGQTVLKRLGFEAITASNGMEAINLYKARTDEIDLIIMDMNMPVLDGEETIKKILNFDGSAKVIVTSGLLSKSQTREMNNLGIRNFLIKPYRAYAVAAVIESALAESD
ncbi:MULTISPECIES: response regulator [unclassified Oceanispirochaeta]|uniref:response regulator n=1 Tax=unclassified Oceanispirochaeta TaxID=2635722 RepID=UPI000E0982FD|nr:MULTISPECIES: response regulator [unclassified Oceanispirochaeta]MBF9014983.1 response regulator [Oceanispirochaeta sp. M2]NPD71336.1 response regulator [Oceanispirochaeta sp. M1]RDG33302.1 response regulator [Oceanispirochaeta sp. M1]